MDFLDFLYAGQGLTSLQARDRFLAESEEEIGKHLLALWLFAQAEAIGLPVGALTLEQAEQIRKDVLTREAISAHNVAVEKALHKAAAGDFATAGRLIREHIFLRAIDFRFLPPGMQTVARQEAFVETGAQASRDRGDANRAKILEYSKQILGDRARPISQRDLTRKIVEKLQKDEGLALPFETVRGHLKALKKEKKLG